MVHSFVVEYILLCSDGCIVSHPTHPLARYTAGSLAYVLTPYFFARCINMYTYIYWYIHIYICVFYICSRTSCVYSHTPLLYSLYIHIYMYILIYYDVYTYSHTLHTCPHQLSTPQWAHPFVYFRGHPSIYHLNTLHFFTPYTLAHRICRHHNERIPYCIFGDTPLYII